MNIEQALWTFLTENPEYEARIKFMRGDGVWKVKLSHFIDGDIVFRDVSREFALRAALKQVGWLD